LKRDDVGLLLQTEEEFFQLEKFGTWRDLVVSPSFLSDEEIDFWTDKSICINLASLQEVAYVLKRHPAAEMSFRLDCTWRQNQRTGIKKRDIGTLAALLATSRKKPFSFHVYSGTGSSLRQMKRSANTTVHFYQKYFSGASAINFGGGFAFDYSAQETSNRKHFDWDGYFCHIAGLLDRARAPQDLLLAFEPGRDILADTGTLYLKIKRIVDEGDLLKLATDGSYVHIPSAGKRRRVHRTIVFSPEMRVRTAADTRRAVLCGCTTLSSDYVIPGVLRVPTNVCTGDIVAVTDVGAYAATQHLEFLNVRPAPEIILDESNQAFLLTKRGAMDDKVRNVLPSPEKI